MRVLVVTATPGEIRPLMEGLGKGVALTDRLTSYRIGSLQLDVIVTGVGMVATTYFLTRLLATQVGYTLAINAGICGSFIDDLAIGEVVIVNKDEFSELGAESSLGFIPLSGLGLTNPDQSPFQNGIIHVDDIDCKPFAALRRVSGVTVNTVHGCNESIRKFRLRDTSDIETMEGAAFFYVCRLENLKCVQLRAISNYVEARDLSKWNTKLAIENLNLVLKDFLHSIPATL